MPNPILGFLSGKGGFMLKVLSFAVFGIFAFGASNAETVCRVYSCNIGYWAAEYSCHRCDSLPRADGGTQYGQTPAAGRYQYTSCYVPSGVKYKDNTGTYEFTSNCNYSI